MIAGVIVSLLQGCGHWKAIDGWTHIQAEADTVLKKIGQTNLGEKSAVV